jgi:hypothetical protein
MAMVTGETGRVIDDEDDFEVLIELRTEWREVDGETKLATYAVQTHLARPSEVVTLCGRGRLLFESTEVEFGDEETSCAICATVRDGLDSDETL